MESFIDRILVIRASEQMKTFDYQAERKAPIIGKAPVKKQEWKECKWCKKQLKIEAITCRGCNTKVAPCVECGGPVGRETQGVECWPCQTRISTDSQRKQRNRNRRIRKAVLLSMAEKSGG